MKTNLAYPNGDKAMYIARVRAHREADELVRCATGQNGKGCSVWCTVHAYDHAKFASLICGDEKIARLNDYIFENLPDEKSQLWPELFLGSIQENADLSEVWPKFVIRMLGRNLIRIGEGNEPWRIKCRVAVQTVIDLYSSKNFDKSAAWAARSARSAESAARSAASWAARSAAWSARSAESAARLAASSAAWAAAESASWSAWAAAESAAWSAEIENQANDLINLISACKGN